jgi:hypothetical protein
MTLPTDKVLALAREAGLAVTISSHNSLYKFAALLLREMEAENAELRKDAERQWVGLTDEEVQDSYNPDYQVQTRAIEAKIKEKNT